MRLKQGLKKKAMEICGEEDRFLGEQINFAPLQISTSLPSVEQAKLSGHGHRREEIAEHFRKEPCGNIEYSLLFEKVKNCVEQMHGKGLTSEAKEKFLLRHGNLVVIAGQPGIGKSTLTKHIVEEMWKSSLYKPDIIFFIRFRDIDYKISTDFLQFLAPFMNNISSKSDRRKILEKLELTENVFIIMDGLDEATIEPSMNQPEYSIFSISTAAGFLQNLVAGNILPQSKKMITSRPYRIAQLPKDFQPKILFTIQGLDEAALSQICVNICSENETAYDKVFGHLQSHPDLKSYCHTPVICIMVMESLYKLYAAEKANEDSLKKFDFLLNSNVDTLTAIFVFVLKEWLVEKLERMDKFQIKEISDLAFTGFSQDQFYFRDYDLKNAKVNFQNNTTFLNTILKGTKIMYFIHLMWQEYLVSVYLILYSSKEEFAEILPQLGSKKYEVVTRFLYGLSNQHMLDELLDYVQIEGLKSKADRNGCKELLKNFAIDKLREQHDAAEPCENPYFGSILPILEWVREMGDDAFTKQAAACLRFTIKTDRDSNILPSDVPTINHVLRSRDDTLTLEVCKPKFIGNSAQYFFKELYATLDLMPNIDVSYRL